VSEARPIRLVVAPERAGERLDRFLAGALGSRSQAQRLIAEGRVTVEGVPRAKRHAVRAGDRVAVDPEPPRAAAHRGPAPFAIAYRDESLLVVDKPAGVVVHPARGHREGTLSQALGGLAGGGPADRPGIVHRLDKDTSGLMLVARDDETLRALQRLLAAREIRREYLALVVGRPSARSGTIDAPLGRDRRRRTTVSVDSDLARPAVTRFSVEEELPGSTLLRVALETGRTHQIRAHLQAIGHPVAGDPDYGAPGAFGLRRQFLHATRLAFAHPRTGRQVDVRSPLPEDLAAALERGRAAGEP